MECEAEAVTDKEADTKAEADTEADTEAKAVTDLLAQLSYTPPHLSPGGPGGADTRRHWSTEQFPRCTSSRGLPGQQRQLAT